MKIKDFKQRNCEPKQIGEVIKEYFEKEYEVPLNEIQIWIENGWKFDEFENVMTKKGREEVKVKESR